MRQLVVFVVFATFIALACDSGAGDAPSAPTSTDFPATPTATAFPSPTATPTSTTSPTSSPTETHTPIPTGPPAPALQVPEGHIFLFEGVTEVTLAPHDVGYERFGDDLSEASRFCSHVSCSGSYSWSVRQPLPDEDALVQLIIERQFVQLCCEPANVGVVSNMGFLVGTSWHNLSNLTVVVEVRYLLAESEYYACRRRNPEQIELCEPSTG